MFELSQLQTLIAVAKSGNFSRAADELHVTQSAISQSIKNLEKKIGTPIFQRSGKKVVLTMEGGKLLKFAKDYVVKMQDTIDEINHDRTTMSGRIRLGTLTGVGKSWLAPKLLEMSREFPDICFSLNLGFQEELIKEFEESRLDALILPEGGLPTGCERVLISEEKSTMVFPKNEKFKITKDITLEELSEYPAILFEENDTLFTKWCRKKFGSAPKKIHARFIINSHGNMLHAVSEGLGIAVVPTHVLNRSYYKDKVLSLGEKFVVSNFKFYLVYHHEGKQLARIRTLRDRLCEKGNPLAGGMDNE
jgi:DNA-binding transcriptional LysR family regulator